MNILVMCSSAFQIIASTQIINTYYQNETADLIITDSIANAVDLVDRFKKYSFYRNVYLMRTRNGQWENWRYTFFGNKYFKNIEQRLPFLKENKYQIYLCANIEGVGPCVAEYLRRKQNTIFNFYEDGFVAYSDYYKRCLDNAFYRSSIKDKVLYMVKRKTIYYINEYYVFNPELIKEWEYKFKIVRIPSINKCDEAVKILNNIYDYCNLKDRYNKKYIFFEESYYADGHNIDDVTIVKEIENIVGKENLMVKIHPRNSKNRFKELGIQTNANTTIPWELIAINEDFSQTTLITISSGSSITSYFIAECKAKRSIMLYELPMFSKEELTPSIVVFDKICKEDEYFQFPISLGMMKEMLEE